MKEFTHNLDSEKDIAPIIDILKEYGVCIIPKVFFYDDIPGLYSEAENVVIEYGSEYEFGINAKISDDECKKYHSINSYYNNDIFRAITEGYLANKRYNFNMAVFITKDFKIGEELARNGFLHFDRYRKFKFMVYLSDVDEICGPLSVIPGSHKIGKELREKEWRNVTTYEGLKNRIEMDHPDIYDESKIIPIIGKAGTLTIFDTDVFHMGGKTNGGQRLIMRSHTDIKDDLQRNIY